MAKRRGSGEGSIYRDGDRWVAKVTLTGPSGRQVRRKRSARTHAEARTRLRELHEELRLGVAPGRLTVGTYLARWLERQEVSDKSRSTVDNYRWAIHRHLVPAIGAVQMAKLAPDDLDQLLRTMAKGGAARNTMMRVRAVLSMALDDAVGRRVVAWNPVTVTKVPAGPAKASRSLTLEQAHSLIEAAHGDRLEVAWLVMLWVGLRPGEVCGLTWDEVDFDAALLHVRHARVADPGGMRLGDPKTRRSVRTLDIPSMVVEALRSHRGRQAAERLVAGPAWSDLGLVVATEVGTMVDPANLRRAFAKLTVAGLGHWHPTELRHSAVSLLSAAGVHLEDLADLAGHSTTRMTGDVYRHAVRPSVGAGAKVVME